MKSIIYKGFILPVMLIITGCTSGSDSLENVLIEAESAELVLPLNNENCTFGTVIGNKALVEFVWNKSNNTDQYDLVIYNLDGVEYFKVERIVENTFNVPLDRGVAYSWKVTSRNRKSTKTSDSETWRFYLAADGVLNASPYPTELISPRSGEIVNIPQGNYLFSWNSVDPDGDNLYYTLFVDEVDGNQEPPNAQKNINQTELTINLEKNKIYYWKVLASDGVNTSVSQTYSFRTAN